MTSGRERRMKSFLPRFFGKMEDSSSKGSGNSLDSSVKLDERPSTSESYSRTANLGFGEPNFSSVQTISIFVATWNVGGKYPHDELNLDDFLLANGHSDMFVLGFQEIVPLNAGNVLVIEDTDPAVKWLSLINQALNKSLEADEMFSPNNYSETPNTKTSTSIFLNNPRASLFFQKLSLKAVSKTFIMEHGKGRLKSCNCSSEIHRKNYHKSCFRCPFVYYSSDDDSEAEEEDFPYSSMITDMAAAISNESNQKRYSLITSKQMVGIFVTVWARRELVQHLSHLKLSCIGRGVMGHLGNKGCISLSMTLHQTSFCFICSHLSSGEKEGDQLRRNSDVNEILKNTRFRKIYKRRCGRILTKIHEHDRIIWFGDLNYRIASSYFETKKLLQDNDWDVLLEKDQLKIERKAGRVFKGWNEGKIYFAPTYKYSCNSDAYTGEGVKSKKKRRTPAWCDRILWHGDGIVQSSYIRGESRFSDHRPVCAVFQVEVRVHNGRRRMGLSSPNIRIGVEELLPPNNSSYSTSNRE